MYGVLQNDRIKLHLISFHAYRGLFDAERVAHELSLRDTAVLIGCERLSDVPEPLRRVADLVLTFPRIDRRCSPAFSSAFSKPSRRRGGTPPAPTGPGIWCRPTFTCRVG